MRSCKVFVCDDNVDHATSLHMILQQMGHVVATCTDAEKAVAEAIAFDPDVVLLDLGMPRKDGLKVAREIRAATTPDRPYLVAVTGYNTPKDRIATRHAGFDAHVAKPIDWPLLESIITLACERWGSP